MTWKNRIIDSGTENPEQLLANPLNWRCHPAAQQEALKGALDELGYIQNVIVNKRTGNLIDGHLRVTLALREGQTEIPVVYVDLDESEEKLALATIDPLSAMAGKDIEKLNELLQEVNTDSEALQQMLAGLTCSGLQGFSGTDETTGDGVKTESKTICPACGHEF